MATELLEVGRVLAIEPLDRRVSYRCAKAREVVDHWAHARGERDERPSRAQGPPGAGTGRDMIAP